MAFQNEHDLFNVDQSYAGTLEQLARLSMAMPLACPKRMCKTFESRSIPKENESINVVRQNRYNMTNVSTYDNNDIL